MYLKRKLCIVENDLSFEIGRISVMRACETKRLWLVLYGTPCIFSVSWCQCILVWPQNFWVLGISIFEFWASQFLKKLQFYTFIDNMHIKLNPKSFLIYICHQKVLLGMKTFWKKFNLKIFCFNFQGKKNFWKWIFQNFFSIPPRNLHEGLIIHISS